MSDSRTSRTKGVVVHKASERATRGGAEGARRRCGACAAPQNLHRKESGGQGFGRSEVDRGFLQATTDSAVGQGWLRITPPHKLLSPFIQRVLCLFLFLFLPDESCKASIAYFIHCFSPFFSHFALLCFAPRACACLGIDLTDCISYRIVSYHMAMNQLWLHFGSFSPLLGPSRSPLAAHRSPPNLEPTSSGECYGHSCESC